MLAPDHSCPKGQVALAANHSRARLASYCVPFRNVGTEPRAICNLEAGGFVLRGNTLRSRPREGKRV